jgi:hypothetical protein
MKVDDSPKASANQILSGTRRERDANQWLSTINREIWGISWVVVRAFCILYVLHIISTAKPDFTYVVAESR